MLPLIQHQPFATFVVIALALASASCVSANAPSSQTTVRVYKSTGSVQCAEGGTDLSSFARQLEQAGLKVISSICGSDGRMRTAMCGAPDGRVAIFELSGADAHASSKLGFAPLSKLPDAQVVPCK